MCEDAWVPAFELTGLKFAEYELFQIESELNLILFLFVLFEEQH